MASQVRRALPPDQNFLRDYTSDDRVRAGGLRRKKRLSQLPVLARQKILKRTPLKKVSKGRKAELAKYRRLTAQFLAKPENSWCICCTMRREMGENIVRNPSLEIHHFAGRIGRLLCYVPFFRAFCNACRTWPHEHPAKAREMNLLAKPHLWNVFPVLDVRDGRDNPIIYS